MCYSAFTKNNKGEKNMSKNAKISLGIAGFLAVVGVVGFGATDSYYTNQEYQKAVVTRFGNITDVTGSGMHYKIPFVDEINKANTQIDKIAYLNQSVATNDNQIITFDLTINHRIGGEKDNLIKLFRQFGNDFDYRPLLKDQAIDRAKSTIGNYRVNDLMSMREQIRVDIFNSIAKAAGKYGINIVDVQLANIEFSPQYKDKLDDVAAQRAKAAEAEQKAEEQKFIAQQAIEQARGSSESKNLASEAEAYRKKLEADAEAHKIEVTSIQRAKSISREGKAEAEALKVKADALQNSKELVEYTRAKATQNWDGSSTPQVIIQGGGDNGGSTSLIPYMNLKEFTK